MMQELHGELAAMGLQADVRFLAMVSTKALVGEASPHEVHATLTKVKAMLQRGDVIGIDFAGPEKGAFTALGMANFVELYDVVSLAAQARGRTLVIRPHVGEGYETGDHAHVELARRNLHVVLEHLQSMGYGAARAAADKVKIRLGHSTHATDAQLQLMAAMGIDADSNIGSNVVTKSIGSVDEHPLLRQLYFGVRTLLGTDGPGVMGTSRVGEYATAQLIIQKFRVNALTLQIDSMQVKFSELAPDVQARFSMDYIRKMEDAHHAEVLADDAHDVARKKEQP